MVKAAPFAGLLLLLLTTGAARADWVPGRAEQVFGPETPEADACRAAEERAREQALKNLLGERLSSEELMVCSEQGIEAECTVNRSVWSMVDGDIRAVRAKRVETGAGPVAGFRRCTVLLEVDIGQPLGQPDPGFDLSVDLNAKVFRDGDLLTLSLAPSRVMHVTVFQWLPYARDVAQVTRIFPSPMDPDGQFSAAATVPTKEGGRRYAMKVVFPDGLPASRRLVDEYLLVVATKDRIEFRETYALDELKSRLLEIPRSDSRLVKRAYAVVRSR